MNDYFQIVLVAMLTGVGTGVGIAVGTGVGIAVGTGVGIAVGTGVGIAVGTYFANKALIKSIEKIADSVKAKNGEKGGERRGGS